MTINLNPTVQALGIMAPVLGPWFSDHTVNLPVVNPTGKLGLNVTLPANTNWLPPATGLMSLYVSSGSPPPALDALQDSDGTFPFPAGRLVAFFRLLPEVEARLHAFIGLVPKADVNPVGVVPTVIAAPTRPQVRSFAIVLPAATPLTPAGLYPFFGGAGNLPGSTDAERMAALGMGLSGPNVANGTVPMSWLRRPGGTGTNQDKLLEGLTGAVDLWAFDRRGRAIDPGAVACWWSWLLNSAVGPAATPQLFAPGLANADYPQASGQPVVVQFAAQRTLHLVDAHEGPLGAPFMNDRLLVGGTAATSNLVQVTGTNSVALTFQALTPPGVAPPVDNPQLDSAPRARVAVLPVGTYGNTATVWPGGPVHAALTRDFARCAVVEEESHLVGVTRRDSRAAVSTPTDRRQSAQNRPSTRINVNRTADTNGVLLANGFLAGNALLAVPNVAGPSRLVLGISDTAWGSATPPVLAPGAGPLPNTLADAGSAAPAVGQYRVRAVTGGGALADDHQIILIDVNLGAPAAAAWVRAWPQGFDLATGLHFELSGGAGRADASGTAFLVAVLPNGRVDALGLLGMDLHVVLPDGTGAIVAQRSYADRRFTRPTPVGGSPANGVSGNWVVCESGVSGAGALPNGSVPPGAHVVLTSGTPAVVDRTTIPNAAWDNGTLIRALQGTDIVSLTTPAFGSAPDRADVTGRPLPRTPTTSGNPNGGFTAIVANRLHRLDRTTLGGATASSVPYTLLDRLEVAAARTAAAAATAAIGSAPPVPWALEPTSAFFHGHPGVPAGIETHGTGAALTGAPAVAVAEYVRERTAGLGFAAVQGLTDPARSAAVQSEIAVAAEASTALPVIADGAGAGPVVAILRTSALGLEGIPGVALAATQTNVFPLSQNVAQLVTWLNNQVGAAGGAGNALRNAAGAPIDSTTRALDRRILTSAFGATESLTALLAAIDRAQDFIYIETPAIDNLSVDQTGENLQLWGRLISRMNSRKGLRVVVCVPALLSAGTPKRLQEVRDHCLMDAVDAMRAAAGDRFALFSPGPAKLA